MRALLIITAVLACTVTGMAQDTVTKVRKDHVRMYWMLPGGIGNNVISKANKGQGGIGVAVTFLRFDRIQLSAGAEIGSYRVTDKSLAGNVEHTNVWQFYHEVLYKIPVSRRIDVNPKFSLGYMCFAQRAQGSNFGRQYGPAFSPGLMVDVAPGDGNFRFFAGLNYTLALPSTRTNDEYRSFFGTIQMLNIAAGIKF